MFRCPICSAEFAENKKSCEFCGSKLVEISETATKPNKKETVSPISKPVAESGVESGVDVVSAPDKESIPTKTKKRFKVKKLLLIGIPAIVALVVAAVLLWIFVFQKNTMSYIFYQKNGELWFTKASNIDPNKLSKNLDGSESDVMISNDGKHIFFYDYDDKEKSEKSLYYIETKNKSAEPVKIDKNVTDYAINKNGNIVTYIKDNNLYQSDLKTSNKIASDVERFYVSVDGSALYYLVKDGEYDDVYDVYYKKGKEEAEKIINDFAQKVSIQYDLGDIETDPVELNFDLKINESFDAVYYTEPNTEEGYGMYKVLYRYNLSNGKEKLNDKVVTFDVYGDILYYTNIDSSYDDEINIGIYRDERFRNISGDGEKIVFDHRRIRENSSLLAVSKNGKTYVSTSEGYVYINDKSISGQRSSFYVTDDGLTVYCTRINTENDKPVDLDVFKYEVETDSMDIYASNVDSFNLYGGKYPVCTIIGKDSKVTYYIENENIGNNVVDIMYFEELNGLLYMTTDEADDKKKSLYTFIDGKSTKIADDVEQVNVLPNGDICYLSNYEQGKGELYLYDGEESILVDKNVENIVYFDYISDDEKYLEGYN